MKFQTYGAWLLGSLALCLSAPSLFAAEAGHSDPVAPVLLGLVVLFTGAKAGGFFAGKLGQPAVLGELVMGVLLGNLGLVGWHGVSFIAADPIFSILAGLGVVLLLFEVGLESSMQELLRVGVTATLVAVIGVVVPFGLGYAVSGWFMPEKSVYVHTFVGAALCATSVGITARVLKDLGKVHLQEAKIVLGAAVIDDVLGLIILAVVSGLIVSVGNGGGGEVAAGDIAWIAGKAIGFLVVALMIGGKLAPLVFRFGARLKTEGMLLSLALSFCFLLSYLAHVVGLAPIVGAFAAGLIIDGSGFAKFFSEPGEEPEPYLEHLIHPISKFFVPIFFVHMGMQVDLTTFADANVLALGVVLTLAAIAGKQACGLVVFGNGNAAVSRLVIGIGMVPRGEVGLIFAVIGAGLMLDGGPVIDKPLYSAIVLMVMLTTMLTPPGLKWALKDIH